MDAGPRKKKPVKDEIFLKIVDCAASQNKKRRLNRAAILGGERKREREKRQKKRERERAHSVSLSRERGRIK